MIFGTTSAEPTKLELDNRALARRAAAEGMVLLENNGVLPLAADGATKKLALFGSGARMTVKGGTGSGAVRERYSVTVEEGLLAKGFVITTNEWLDRYDSFYKDTYEAYRNEVEEKVKGIKNFSQILHLAGRFEHPTGVPITESDVNGADTDTAIYVLARQAGEGNDREQKPGDYLLDELEAANLRAAAAHFNNLIVVINVGGMIDLSVLDEIKSAAVVYISQPGEEGGNALADLLCGDVNFSGKLATSWANHFEDIPSSTTYSYLGGDAHHQQYNEGLYVGYRFYDTFGVKPRYHFGYGLGYTTFAVETKDVALIKRQEPVYFGRADERTAHKVIVRAAVTNTGRVAGREVVQVYATVSFGDGAEQQRLVAFGKTKKLAPGECEVLTLTFDVNDLTRYDEAKAAYVITEGEYILRVGTSSVDTEPAAVLKADHGKIVKQCRNLCAPKERIEEVVPQARVEETPEVPFTLDIPVDDLEVEVFTYEAPDVKKESGFDEALLQKAASLTDAQLATLVCGGGTRGKRIITALGASGSTTAELYDSCGIPNVILSDGPAGLNLTSHIVEMPGGEVKAAKVSQNLEAYRRYLFGFAKIMMTSQMANPEDGTMRYQYTTAWPCSQLLAQSFDETLLYEVGDATGQEMEAYGVTVWLAPGMNIHRNPLCGRTFEYYSEDPLVSGKMAAAIVRGVQSHPGKGMSIKHFVANNCELERNFSSSDVNERALRELYLKGFEIAVRESAPMTVMASYNKVNGCYATNNEELLVKILRGEWGFDGLVMSDWDSMKADPQDKLHALSGDVTKAHAAQCDLVMPGRPDQIEALTESLAAGTVKREDLVRSAYRILRMVACNTFAPIKENI